MSYFKDWIQSFFPRGQTKTISWCHTLVYNVYDIVVEGEGGRNFPHLKALWDL